ncbi:MAG TPA: hypothetical protein VE225_07170, partial [Rubrobacteraceae bacterium]|nr:hypothetical protein [Rubrobacteraceae bacterium]
YLARGVERASVPQPDEYERVEVVLVPLGEVLAEVKSGNIISSSGVAAILLAIDTLNNSG